MKIKLAIIFFLFTLLGCRDYTVENGALCRAYIPAFTYGAHQHQAIFPIVPCPEFDTIFGPEGSGWADGFWGEGEEVPEEAIEDDKEARQVACDNPGKGIPPFCHD